MNNWMNELSPWAANVVHPKQENNWIADHPAEYKWIRTSKFDFAVKMLDVLTRWGGLTEGQLRAVQACIEREKAWAARTMPEGQLRGHSSEQSKAILEYHASDRPAAVDLRNVPPGMYAVPGGDTRLKVKITHGSKNWAGWVFVSDGAEYGSQRKYGKQAPNGSYRGEIVEQLRAIAASPAAASAAYGRLVGRCGICGRMLEDEESVARGIGPVCAAKYGW